MQQKSGWNADQRDHPAHPLVDVQGALADVAGAERHDLVDQAQSGLWIFCESKTMSRR